MTETSGATVEMRRALVAAIERQAGALATGTFVGPEYGAVRRLLHNVETLAAWTPDDRS